MIKASAGRKNETMSEFPLDKTETRSNFAYFLEVQTRWNDHDSYGHVNNARFHALFDTVIMHYMLEDQGLDLIGGPAIPFTVENMCRFHQQLSFPDVVQCGMRVARIGNSSVRYEFGLFAKGREPVAATGYFVDVYVDSATHQPVRLPDDLRAALERIAIQA